MKLLLIVVFIFLNLIFSTTSYSVRGPASTNTEHAGHCWSEEQQKLYKPGEFFYEYSRCEKHVCEENLTFLILGCSSFEAKYNSCYVKQKLKKPYPGCCPTVTCPPEFTAHRQINETV